MKVIRYAVRKHDLHSLLRGIGVLQESEHLLAVNNIDLADASQDIVVITVTTRQQRILNDDISVWTDANIQDTLTELTILEDAAMRQLQLVIEEMNKLRFERRRRELSEDVASDGVPGAVERVIRDQLRTLLSRTSTDE